MGIFLRNPLIILICSQLVFTLTDLLGRYGMTRPGTVAERMIRPWILLFVGGHVLASLGQLYVFSKFEVGKTVALFGAVSIMMASVLGYLLLQETLSISGYLGVMIAVTAFLVLAIR